MPLFINPVNDQGLAALSGRATPYLNLEPSSLQPGNYYQAQVQGLFKQADLQQQYAQQANALAVANTQENAANIRNQAMLGNQLAIQKLDKDTQLQIANQTNQTTLARNTQDASYQNALVKNDTTKTNIAGQQQQQEQAYQQGMLANNTATSTATIMGDKLKQYLDMTQNERNLNGGISAAILQVMRMGGDPTTVQARVKGVLDEAVSQGRMSTTDEQTALQQVQTNPQAVYGQSLEHLMLADKGSDIISSLNLVPGTGAVGAKINEQNQTDLNNMQSALIQMKALRDQVAQNPQLFGTGVIKGAAGEGEHIINSLTGQPSTPGSYADIADQRAKLLSEIGNTTSSIYASEPQKMKLNPSSLALIQSMAPQGNEMSGSQALNKIDATVDSMEALSALKQQQMNNPDMDMTSFNKTIQGIHDKYFGVRENNQNTSSSNTQTQTGNTTKQPIGNSYTIQGHVYSGADLENLINYNMQKFGKTRPEVEQQLQQMSS